MGKYSIKKNEDETESSDEQKHHAIDRELDRFRKLDETNPLEQMKKYNIIKSNPPKPGFMEVKCHEEEKPNGEIVVVSKSKQLDGETKVLKFSPFFVCDLNVLLLGDISACPSTTVPMLIDMAQKLVELKKGAFKPEKVKEEFNWWWIVFFLLLIPGIITMILMFMR